MRLNLKLQPLQEARRDNCRVSHSKPSLGNTFGWSAGVLCELPKTKHQRVSQAGLLSLANKIPAARADPAAPVGFFNASASWERLAEKRHPPNPAGGTGTGIRLCS